MVKFTIDGRTVTAQKGETILQVARREGIYIPTMCYLTKVKPIESCRLCVVEVEGVDGFVLSCQTPVVPDIEVRTNSEELYKHRQNIMRLYDVNHPLECGVCDKSGECDLQNKTLEFGVDTQEFTAKDQYRPIQKWNYIQYDPSLCILCEKCVHVCNEVIGDDAIEIEYGGYKSKIVPKNAETLDCTFCGECIAVCPVGALISSDFKYTSNAWELQRIPAACAHCSAACHLFYETKHSSIENPEPKIYRVKNDFEFETLCGAGRFGFDFENKATKDEKAFEKALEAFKKADTIRFTSYITNEEALILQKLKEKFGYKLINNEARNYQKFLQNYAAYSGKNLYGADLKTIEKSDFIILLGSFASSDNPAVRYAFTVAHKQRNAQIINMHPVEDDLLKPIVTKFVKYEVGSEEAVMGMLLDALLDEERKSQIDQKWFDELDMGYLSAESSVGEEEIEDILAKLNRKKRLKEDRFTLILGEDLYGHPRAENIARLAGLIDRFTEFDVMIIPPKTNSLGVALICDLDDEGGAYSIGYNTKGNFTLSALGDGDLDMPALNQQEGTFTNIDRRVVPTNVALPYEGYVLNDIARALEVSDKEYTIEFTKELPQEKGYQPIEFDDLPNEFLNDGSERRGYVIEPQRVNLSRKNVEPIAELPEFNGTVIYRCEPVLQFSPFTNKAHQLNWSCDLIGSEQFSIAAKLSDGDKVVVQTKFGAIAKTFRIDPKLKGTVALLGVSDMGIEFFDMQSSYRYERVKITKRADHE
ncbi:NADH-quinone oxidoreductase subunit G [Nitratiruptor sp. SB155-2]|uniref:NADH-quinone oxidoreductase subunit G n=1 Tax=Nitratiruptor sp. (strain SB155-2) TaxID=387092 RepID=UPI0001586DB9|nr:NADH-quinone oxidoreductase subunit G [Nitratiruptor sp. SB155-2]BAF69408.1 NADH-quinone oxidoreductase, chain G [Nitratiruptor sp. SB155-2]